MTFNHSMSIPMEHRLVETPEGTRLTRTPVKELESLRNKNYKLGKFSLKENDSNPLKNITIELAELRTEFDPGKASEVTLNIRGVKLVYNAANKELIGDGVKAPVSLVNGKLKLAIYADRTGLEIFANDGLLFMPININIDDTNRSLSFSAKGGTVKVASLDVYELKSIWN